MQLALTVAGAALGSYFGPVGTSIGASIGSAIGAYYFGPEMPDIEGPRITDLKVQTSTFGTPIPIVYGAYRLTGNVIYSTDIIETRLDEEIGGKGPSSVTKTSYSYSVSCAVGVCEGPVDGIRRIWANGKLIYNADTGLIDTDIGNLTIYLGGEDQTPDPFWQGIYGDVPAHRGLAYVSFENLQLATFGNRIPNFSFEVYPTGSIWVLISQGNPDSAYTQIEFDNITFDEDGNILIGGGGSYESYQALTQRYSTDGFLLETKNFAKPIGNEVLYSTVSSNDFVCFGDLSNVYIFKNAYNKDYIDYSCLGFYGPGYGENSFITSIQNIKNGNEYTVYITLNTEISDEFYRNIIKITYSPSTYILPDNYPEPTIQWSRRLDIGYDLGRSILSQDQNYLYVLIDKAESSGGLIKFNLTTQVVVWAKEFNYRTLGINLDSSGNIVVGGIDYNLISEGGNNIAFAVITKFDSDGNVIWCKKNEASASIGIIDIQIDSQDNIYYLDNPYREEYFNDEYFSGVGIGVTKLNSSGEIIWNNFLYVINNIYTKDITVTGINGNSLVINNGGIFVIGSTYSLESKDYNTCGVLSKLLLSGGGTGVYDEFGYMPVSMTGSDYTITINDISISASDFTPTNSENFIDITDGDITVDKRNF